MPISELTWEVFKAQVTEWANDLALTDDEIFAKIVTLLKDHEIIE